MNVYQKTCVLEKTTYDHEKDKIIANMRCQTAWNILGRKNVLIQILLNSYYDT